MEQERRRREDRDWEALFTFMEQTRDQLSEQNGYIRRHNEEIFGDGREQSGLKKNQQDLHDLATSIKSSMKTLMFLVSTGVSAAVIALVYNIATHSP